ncbi:Aldo/keto reductase [Neoconidiobolus thromboides FSU 785]|nr:Aldo/keto reductase [Neoconidiobolus thromboides FSU 785]
MKPFLLASGAEIPRIGLGTWQLPKDKVGGLIKEALKLGYRHLDCALDYGNEKEIGDAIRESGIKRNEIFITSKLWNTYHRPDLVKKAITKTLADLQVDYLDLYLIHFPHPEPAEDENIEMKDFKPSYSIVDTWNAMQELVDLGLVKHIGVSNFTINRIKDVLNSNPKHLPAANQVELHPYLAQNELIDFCNQHNIHVTGYSPLGSNNNTPVLIKEKILLDVAEKYKASPAQVLLSWGIARGTSVIPRTTNFDRLKQNIELIELSKEDTEAINSLNQGIRFNTYYDVYDY